MKILLLDKINKLGSIGDEVNVKAGFARNYLIPQGKALVITPENIAFFESKRKDLEKASTDKLVQAQGLANEISELKEISILARASEDGKLYGSVKQVDIVAELKKQNISIEKQMVLMGSSIQHIGEYELTLQLHPSVNQLCKVIIGAL